MDFSTAQLVELESWSTESEGGSGTCGFGFGFGFGRGTYESKMPLRARENLPNKRDANRYMHKDEVKGEDKILVMWGQRFEFCIWIQNNLSLHCPPFLTKKLFTSKWCVPSFLLSFSWITFWFFYALPLWKQSLSSHVL